MKERGLGAVGLRRFAARVGDALPGIDLSPLERSGSIPMDAATLGSLASRLTQLYGMWRVACEQRNALADERVERGRQIVTLMDRNDALVAEVHLLTRQLHDAAGIQDQWVGDSVDTGALTVSQGTLLDPLAAAEARLRAATETTAPAGTLCAHERKRVELSVDGKQRTYCRDCSTLLDVSIPNHRRTTHD